MTMSTEQVIDVPAELNSPRQMEIAGKSGVVALSPFDFPRYARVVFREFEDKNRLTIRLMYDVANDEAIEETIKNSGVALAVGKESGRVFSILLTMKKTPGVSADLGPYLQRVHECLLDLQNKTIQDRKHYMVRKNAHYRMVESFMPIVAKVIAKSAAG